MAENITWKPDFTKPNPYEGMPAGYAQLVSGGFVPTTAIPLNPVQVAAIQGRVNVSPDISNLTPAQQNLLGARSLNDLTPAQRTAVLTGNPIPISGGTASPASKVGPVMPVPTSKAVPVFPPPAPPKTEAVTGQAPVTQSDFDKKWGQYTRGKVFTGTDAQYAEYQKDFNALQAKIDAESKIQAKALAYFEKYRTQVKVFENGKPVMRRANAASYDLDKFWNSNPTMTDEAKVALLRKAGFSDMAIADIGVSSVSSLPKSSGLGEQLGYSARKTQSDIAAGVHKFIEAAPAGSIDKAIISSGGGLLLTATGLLTGGLSLAGDIITAPGKTPQILLQTGKGMGQQVVDTAVGLAKGKYMDSLKEGDASQVVSDVANSVLIVDGAIQMSGGAIRAGQFAKAVVSKDYIPLRSMSTEASTARVPFTDTQLAKMRTAGVTEADIIKAGTDITTQLASGAKRATVSLGGVKVNVRNVPYQKSVGLSLFHGTPDITVWDRPNAPIIKTLYTAGKVALEPIERSYLTGQRAIHPGIVEIKITDPTLIKDIAPQTRLISGGKVLEPEAPIPSLDELKGMGYRLEEIPGPAGKGTTFDANLGPVGIRRYTLAKVTDNPTGLRTVETGRIGDTGIVAVGDLHGTFRGVIEDINSAYGKQVIKGNPTDLSSLHWNGGKETVVIMGDSIDRGKSYLQLRDTFNRLHDEARVSGGNVVRLLGNHELAYLSKDAIKGIEYTDKERVAIRAGILDDLKSGRAQVAYAENGKLFTHAGVSSGVFPEFKGKSAEFVARSLNERFVRAIRSNHFNDKMFAKGRVERGNSLSKNERDQGGIFWLRPQEAKAGQLDLGFEQVVGHNPSGFGVRRVWGKNFIETDVGRHTGGRGVYADTPFKKTAQVDIGTGAIPGTQPKISDTTMARLKLAAMRDTVADVFLGWDGRIKAIEDMKNNREAIKAMAKMIDGKIKERKASGDSIGVKFLKRQKSELISPTGSDYLYGGVRFWRDIVMGRQNSVRVLNNINSMSRPGLLVGVRFLNTTRNKLSPLSDIDTRSMFGVSKSNLMAQLDTKGLQTENTETLRATLKGKLSGLRDAVDEGVDRNVRSYLNTDEITSRYADELQRDISRMPSDERAPTERRVSDKGRAVRITEIREPPSRVPNRPPNAARTPDRVPPRTPERIPVREPERRISRVDQPTEPRQPLRGKIDQPQRQPRPPVKPPLPKTKVMGKGEEPTREQLRTATALKAGFGWWVKFADGNQKFYTDKKLPGEVKKVAPGKKSGYRSVQTFEGTPTRTDIKIGFLTAKVDRPAKEPGKPGAVAYAHNFDKGGIIPGEPGEPVSIEAQAGERIVPLGDSKKELAELVAYAKANGDHVDFVGNKILHDYAATNPEFDKLTGWPAKPGTYQVNKNQDVPLQVQDLRHELIEDPLMKSGVPYGIAHPIALRLEKIRLTPAEIGALAKLAPYSVEHMHDDGDLTIKTKDGDYVVTTGGQTFKGTKNQETKMATKTKVKSLEELMERKDSLKEKQAESRHRRHRTGKPDKLPKLKPPKTQPAKVPVPTGELTTKERNRLPDSAFAIPEKRAYPIHDASHARNALARVAQHGTSMQKHRVRLAVYARYPELGGRLDKDSLKILKKQLSEVGKAQTKQSKAKVEQHCPVISHTRKLGQPKMAHRRRMDSGKPVSERHGGMYRTGSVLSRRPLRGY